MKINDFKKLHTKTVGELRKEVEKLQKELMELRMQKALNKSKNTRLSKMKRRDLAQVKTVLGEKEYVEKASETIKNS